ncbi:hypothetical protein SAMN05421664_0222 [Chryseobacterium soldanellicola]|uniref:Uncharacterized protein n=1 Tax=Chryseobacterium soldanellicola TaxID=311333 RepID=A0A1H0XSJ8_9FLAO|nr:hypothetical protein SAMN05421664_0222 [Chryseobacterium soldanellicola]
MKIEFVTCLKDQLQLNYNNKIISIAKKATLITEDIKHLFKYYLNLECN